MLYNDLFKNIKNLSRFLKGAYSATKNHFGRHYVVAITSTDVANAEDAWLNGLNVTGNY
jgi:hypothetical protein